MTVEDRAAALAAELDAEEGAIKEDLENLINYSVPLDEAERSLRRKYGDDDQESPGTVCQSIDEITPDHDRVELTAVVLSVGKRSIIYDGEQQVITEGEFGDATGRIKFTAWDEFAFEPGDTIEITGATVREYENRPEVNLGAGTTVEIVDADLPVADDVDPVRPLAELTVGDRAVTIEVTVLERESREIDGRDGPTTIWSGIFADETARLPFTDWEAREPITEGASLRIANAYIREYQGVPAVNCGEFTTVTQLDRSINVSRAPVQRSIGDAVETGGLYGVQLIGRVVDIGDGSGLIERCPECGRIIQSNQCRTHGAVEPEFDLRTKAILDDGTGVATVVLGTEITERIYGGSIADAQAATREAMNDTVIADVLADELLGKEFAATGQLSVDEYGATFQASNFTPVDWEPATRARETLSRLEAQR